MRIAFIGLKGLPTTWTGIEYHVDRLGRALVARGHEVTAYTRSCYTPPRLHEHAGMRLVSLPTIRTKHLDASVHSLLASCHAVFPRYDVVHYHGIGPGCFGVVPRMLGRRVVCTVHRLDWESDKWGRSASFLLRCGESMALRAAARTIVVSAGLQAHVKARHGRDSVLIPNGQDPVSPRGPERIRDRYGLEGRDYILFMGRLSPEKRVDWLIDAFRALARPTLDGKATKLIVSGGFNATDEYVAELHRRAGGDPRIIFPGFVAGQEKEELLSNACLFVLPSRIEGLPIALLEAMGYGLCCLASDIPPNREILDSGEGELFDANRPEDLVEKLQGLLDSPDRMAALGAAAKRRVAAHIGWDEVASRTEAVYRELAPPPP